MGNDGDVMMFEAWCHLRVSVMSRLPSVPSFPFSQITEQETRTKMASQQQQQQQQHFTMSILILLVISLLTPSTMAFSIQQQQHAANAQNFLRSMTTTTTTSSSLQAWSVPSVPTSVWVTEAHPTARRVEYYDE